MPIFAANFVGRLRLFSFVSCVGLAMTLAAEITNPSLASAERASMYKLDNGMDVVVIPDHRAPVVTHMVWYRVGAADEQPGISGIAHFLEHLMFKATENMASGEFSKTIARLGGQDNAFTSQDVTAYFQRIARDRLPTVMKMEAERMTKLRLEEKEVLTERDVIKEERRSRTDNNPSSILAEEMNAALYQSSVARPYSDAFSRPAFSRQSISACNVALPFCTLVLCPLPTILSSITSTEPIGIPPSERPFLASSIAASINSSFSLFVMIYSPSNSFKCRGKFTYSWHY